MGWRHSSSSWEEVYRGHATYNSNVGDLNLIWSVGPIVVCSVEWVHLLRSVVLPSTFPEPTLLFPKRHISTGLAEGERHQGSQPLPPACGHCRCCRPGAGPGAPRRSMHSSLAGFLGRFHAAVPALQGGDTGAGGAGRIAVTGSGGTQ